MTQAQCVEKYGPIVDGQWPQQATHCTMAVLPDYVSERLINASTGKPCTHLYVNSDMKAPLLAAFENLKTHGCLGELKTFDGCLSVRPIRGPGVHQDSAHCWAMAIDLNAIDNRLGGPSKWSYLFVRCFTDAGFTWGGDFSRHDPMHFSLAGF